MKNHRIQPVLLTLTHACRSPATASEDDSASLETLPSVAAHVERAQVIAGEDWGFLSGGFLCKPAEHTIPMGNSHHSRISGPRCAGD